MQTSTHRTPTGVFCRLGRQQTRVLADALEPIVKQHGSRERTARALGVKENAIQNVMLRRASTSMSRQSLDDLAAALGIDVSGWDVSTEI